MIIRLGPSSAKARPRLTGLPNSYCSGAGGLDFLEPGFEVVEDFGWVVPFLDFDVEVGEIAWFVVEIVPVLSVVGGVDPDGSDRLSFGRGEGHSALRGFGTRLSSCRDGLG